MIEATLQQHCSHIELIMAGQKERVQTEGDCSEEQVATARENLRRVSWEPPPKPESSILSSSESAELFDSSANASRRRMSQDSGVEADIRAAEWNQHLREAVGSRLTGSKSFISRTGSRNFSRGVSRQQFRELDSKWLPSAQSACFKVAESAILNSASAMLIAANAVFVGLHVDWGIKNALSQAPVADPPWADAIHLAYAIVMAAEVCLRMLSLRLAFFVGPDWRWHVFDTIIVLVSIVDEACATLNLRFVRVLGALRILRMLQTSRLVRDLRLMVACIMQSLVSLMWALLLLLSVIYVFSICFVEAATLQLRIHGFSAAMKTEVSTWYPSLFSTMMTLLQSITGGVNWEGVSRPLSEISFVYQIVFAFYIFFVVIGMLNVLTGIFVENACEQSGLDRQLVIQSRLKHEDAFMSAMNTLFEEADKDGSGTLGWEEFQRFLKDEQNMAYLATQQLDAYDAWQLFRILQIEKDQEVSISAFISGLRRLKGTAKSVDVVALLQETRKMSRKMQNLMESLMELGAAPATKPTSTLLSISSQGAGYGGSTAGKWPPPPVPRPLPTPSNSFDALRNGLASQPLPEDRAALSPHPFNADGELFSILGPG